QPVNDNDITITLNDNPVGATVDASGELTIPAGTAAGDYTITYTVCEKLNPANCSSSSVEVTVEAASISAVADDFSESIVNGANGGIVGDLTANDLLNGQPVNDQYITISISDNGGLSGATIGENGILSLSPETPAGTYTLTYQVCENLNISNCSSALVVITIGAPDLDALSDNFSNTPVDGQIGGVVGNVIQNDIYNNASVSGTSYSIVIIDSSALDGLSLSDEGVLSILSETPSGTYTISYQLCEQINNSCDLASVLFVVENHLIQVNPDDFSETPINGYEGGTVGNVINNDELGLNSVAPGDVVVTITNNGGLSGAVIDENGILSISPETPAGTYTITYQVCEELNPTNCAESTVMLDVSGEPDLTDTDGDGILNINDLDDDNDGIPDNIETRNGELVDSDGDGIIDSDDLDSDGDGITDNLEAGLSNFDLNNDGMVDGEVGTNGLLNLLERTPDSGTINYLMIDTDGDGVYNFQDVDDDNDGILTKLEGNADIDEDGIPNYLDLDSDGDGIPDNIEAQSSADYALPSGEDLDQDGLDNNYEQSGIIPIDTDEDGIPDYLDQDSDGDSVYDEFETGFTLSGMDSDNDGFDNNIDRSDGYGNPNGIIQDPEVDLLNTDYATNVNFRNEDDDGDGVLTIREHPNPDQNGKPQDPYDSDGNGTPDYLQFNRANENSEDDLEVFQLLTPDGDGMNDRFIIRNIEEYPNNTMKIFNRWGVIVYEVESYGTGDNFFTGESKGRVTISSHKQLPVGTYYYILSYTNENNVVKNRTGYIYINR
ncbi:MAG TPA: gliding motility-associated C-terminal domain-containing protein, partial [Prolixibacteraceae bacterium]|nr:gliding motility-associated C-terminal domain-containing protein [Prolixibacteraceae bacterium]